MLPNIFQADAAQPADSTVNIVENLGETIGELAEMPVKDILMLLAENALHIGLKVLAAIVIYSAGAWIIQRVKKLLKKIMTKRSVEASLSTFILSFVSITLTGLLLLVTIQTLGVDTSSIVALIAGSGLAIGMALSGHCKLDTDNLHRNKDNRQQDHSPAERGAVGKHNKQLLHLGEEKMRLGHQHRIRFRHRPGKVCPAGDSERE